MRLVSFEVQGFKNLTAKVALEDLGPINVIHGPNNVGKSNLLQAMQVFFRVLRFGPADVIPFRGAFKITDQHWGVLGLPRTDAFNLESPILVRMEAAIELDDSDLLTAGIQAKIAAIRIALELRWMGAHVDYEVSTFDYGPSRAPNSSFEAVYAASAS